MARKSVRGARRSGIALVSTIVVLSALGCGGAAAGGGDDDDSSKDQPVKLGVMAMITGPGAAYGPPTVNSAKLAASEINANGGVLGRKLQLEFGDTANDPKKAFDSAQRLISKDRVEGMTAVIDSASREAIIPAIDRSGIPFLYAGPYEGGSCNEHMYATGSVPETSAPIFSHVQDSLGGKSWYMTGNDYVYSHKLNEASQKFIEEAGGKVVGSDYVPLGTSDMSQMLDKIKKAKPDHIFTSLVGSDLDAFIKQAHSFGISDDTTIITTGVFDSQVEPLMPAIDGVYTIAEWSPMLEEPRSQEFTKAYDEMFPGEPQTNALGENAYNAVQTWALAAEKAESTDPDKVLEALAGLTYEDAPRGSVTLDAATHHTAMHIYLLQARKDGKLHVVKSFGPIEPGPQCSF